MTQRPFLHYYLNDIQWGEEGDLLAYQPKLEETLADLPKEYAASAKSEQSALAAIVKEFANAARPIEYAHWRARMTAYHQAVENGDYIVVDNNRFDNDPDRAENNSKHLNELGLGKMNRDFFYITSTTRSNDNQLGQYSALIYLRRKDYPEPFRLFDEVADLNRRAKQAVWDHLGIPR